jgi:uncharacterized membrane protein YagU involved in acid resistance
MQKPTLNQILLGGLAGTAAMSLLVFIAPFMGIPMGGPWNMLAMFMKAPIAVGWILHFAIGVILAAVYGFLFRPWLPGNRYVRGALYGIFPWLLAMLVVVPMMGGPVFMGAALKAMGSLLGHLVYGAVLGAFIPLPDTEA